MTQIIKWVVPIGFYLSIVAVQPMAVLGQVNLVPYKPSSWSDKIVVSRETGTNTDSSNLTTNDTLYIDWAMANTGNSATTDTFYTALYVDGVYNTRCIHNPTLAAGYYRACKDYNLGTLSAGSYTLKMVVDYTNAITESNENDNEYTKTITVGPGSVTQPNITPYKPSTWDDKIVVSTVTSTRTDDVLTTNDTLYVDLAVINNGDADIDSTFQVSLSVDGVFKTALTKSSSLKKGWYTYWNDRSIGSLSAGSHTITIAADYTNTITETNESDNSYTKTISVVAATTCFPLTTAVSPQGAGTVTNTHSPNCVTTTANVSSLAGPTDQTNQQSDRPADLSEPTTESLRATAFNTLIAKTQAEDRVKVIVGLRIEGQFNALAQNLTDIAAQSPLIFQAQDSLLGRMASYNVSSTKKFKFIPYMAMEVDRAALEYLARDTNIRSIEEDKSVSPSLKESVPLIGADQAWNLGFSGSGQTVAILDTGVDKTHPFLEGKVVSEACYSTTNTSQSYSSLCPDGVASSTAVGAGVPAPAEVSGYDHGTHVAGIAAGNGKTFKDFSGVAKDAKIIAIQVFSRVDDSTKCGTKPSCLKSWRSDQIQGLERVLELSGSLNIAAANLSLGGGKYSSNCDNIIPSYKAAIDNLKAVGIATITSSGNGSYKDAVSRPACISSIVTVGSTEDGSGGTTTDTVANTSNSSPMVDLLAPGRWINSSIPGGDYRNKSGTSMAAPQVAGAWAVLKSKIPTASVEQVLAALTSTGKPITDLKTDNSLTKPRIQVGDALTSLTPVNSYTSGTNITLTATPNPGFQFKSWTGCNSVSGNTCTVQMNLAKNVSAIFEPVVTAQPDLILTSVTGPTTATVEGTVTIAASTLNQGAGNAGSFYLGFYLSADPTITTSDTVFAVCNSSSGLRAGKTSGCSGPIILPVSVTPGTYFYGAIIDYQNQVTESNEVNNTRIADSGTITVTQPITILPNLTPHKPSGWSDKIVVSTVTGTNTDSTELTTSDTLYVDWGVINNGSAATGSSFQVTLSVDGVLKNTWTSSALNANTSLPIIDYSINSLNLGSHTLLLSVDPTNAVSESNESDNSYAKTIVVTDPSASSVIPIILTAAGLNNSFFTSEMTLTNRGTTSATITYTYSSAFGGGGGSASDSLGTGEQKIVSDAVTYLISLGLPIPPSGKRGGTLAVDFSGSSDVGIMVRTTTAVSGGRAGLAYPSVSSQEGFTEPVYLAGLRQNTLDRSNVAFQNLGRTAADGNITLRTTIFSGDPYAPGQEILEDQTLSPGGFFQHSGVLGNFTNGYVKVERVSGTAPFYAYGVINDQVNSDGSFVFPITESSLVGKTGQTLPVIVETSVFNSELTVTNFSVLSKTIDFSFVADGVQTTDKTATFKLTILPGEQKIIPEVVAFLRAAGVNGIGSLGPTYAGAVFATVASGDMSGIVIGARTASPGGGGQYGLFYNAVPFGTAFTNSAWIYGLQQNAENRSNLALINTGELDSSTDSFSIDLYDGSTGLLVNTVNVEVLAKRWHQINSIFSTYAPGTSQGYAHVRKTSGNNPFIAYGVINDGGAPGQRSGDGAYVPAQ